MNEEITEQDLPVNGCPTPTKKRFATLEAAEMQAEHAGFALGKTLYPYNTCRCGWYHLTSKKNRATLVVPRSLDELCGLDDEDFHTLVRDDATGNIHHVEAVLLRYPVLLLWWGAALKAFQINVEMQLAARKGDVDPVALEWRKRTAIVRRSIAERRAEFRKLASQTSPKDLHAGQVRRPSLEQAQETGSQKALRAVAGEAAIDRLITAHPRDFTKFLMEEYEKVGADTPPRIEKWRRKHEAVRKSEEGEEDEGD